MTTSFPFKIVNISIHVFEHKCILLSPPYNKIDLTQLKFIYSSCTAIYLNKISICT